MPQKLSELKRIFALTDSDLWNVRLKILDEQIVELLLYAEKKCRKLSTGEVEHSPEVSEASENGMRGG